MSEELKDCCDKTHCKCCEALELLEDLDYDDLETVKADVEEAVTLLKECCDHCEAVVPHLAGRRRPRPHHPSV
jgi:hypothetical protein